MEKDGEFDLDTQVTVWYKNLNSLTEVTEADAEELRTHLLDLIDELKACGLDNEEAFWVASNRMGKTSDLGSIYTDINKPIIQLRRSLVILAGVLAYYLLYYFIHCSSKLIYISLLYFQMNGYVAISWISKYLIAIHLMVMVFVASIYFFEQKTISFIENIKLKPTHTFYLLLSAVVLSVLNTCLYPIIKNMTLSDRTIFSHLHHIYIYFDFIFPFTICAGFTILYSKYNRIARI
ncbi:hypothetical protein ADIARSV_2482 [Arcticibacter svalbardensis MN12-7]|uniref:Uncharacterized protein n=1 Tax=Arcticibacter svalbardensis MN12-7 TaxID=1150600 RepID=R9GRM2_9SPHI|nr:permease prefix domain 1-containing protein [Arcticibacter svalbardensis]EOR94348.1 hypothetical protein ADIARSV_2482 [Arcticibacter svalbardensis MN12-7]